MERFFAPYAIGYPDPLTHLSGLAALSDHAAELRRSFAVSALKVDHLCAQPWSHDGEELAVRWTLSARHVGTYQGLPATDREVFILGLQPLACARRSCPDRLDRV